MFLEGLFYLLGKLGFFVGAIFNGSSFPKPLTKEEENDCLIRIAKGDKTAREKLITHNMRLVAHVVKKYSGSADTDDLISVGSIGLIKAVDTFNAEKGTQFATYTARCIENEILMLLRSNKKYKNDISLVATVGADKDGNELTLMDLLKQKDDEVFYEVNRSIAEEKLIAFVKRVLTQREYEIICLRYGLKTGRSYPQREVARFLKISRSYVSRIEKKAIEKLQTAVKEEKIEF